MTIADWRTEIDKLDNELLRLLNQRARIASRIGKAKTETNLPLADNDRERALVARLCHINAGPLDDAAVAAIFQEIISQTRRVEARVFQRRYRYKASRLLPKVHRVRNT